MKKSKGFTLIELITVLVILAIIALIATPIVLNMVSKAEASANKRSVDGYGKAIEYAIASYIMDKGTEPSSIDNLDIEYSGNKVECEYAFIIGENTRLLGDVDGDKEVTHEDATIVQQYNSRSADPFYMQVLSDKSTIYFKAADAYLQDGTLGINDVSVIRFIASGTSNKSVVSLNGNKGNMIYLDKCKVNGKEVKDESQPNKYYHYHS